VLPYPAHDERFRSDRRSARQAAVLLGAGVVIMGSAFVGCGVVLSRLDVDLLPIEAPHLGKLSPQLAEPSWRRLQVVDAVTGETRASRPIDAEQAAGLAQFQTTRAVDQQTRLVEGPSGVRTEDVATGAVGWRAELGRTVLGFGPVSGPVVGVVVIGQENAPLTETVYIDIATGLERWRTPSGLLSSFAFDPATNTAYEYGEDHALLARDPVDGSVRWRADRPFGRLFAHAGTVWAAGDGRLTAYDGASGAIRSDTAIDPGEALPVAVAGTTVVLARP
jgi:outer membrane protein assembly factor BamB